VFLPPGIAPGARLVQEWYVIGKHQFAKYAIPLSFLTSDIHSHTYGVEVQEKRIEICQTVCLAWPC